MLGYGTLAEAISVAADIDPAFSRLLDTTIEDIANDWESYANTAITYGAAILLYEYLN